jgi:GNAT superfamily N-acetyltransferase
VRRRPAGVAPAGAAGSYDARVTLPDGVAVRRARPADAVALTHLHLDCWDDAYTGLVPQALLDERRRDLDRRIEFWRDALEQGVVVWLAEHDGALVGFAGAGPGRDDDPADALELRVLYVRAAWWGTPVGHELFVRAVGERASYLCVLEGNDRAIRFYERQGYRADGTTQEAAEGRHLRMVRPSGHVPS